MRHYKPTGRPRGRQFKLSVEAQIQVYATYRATPRGKRTEKLEDLADDLGVCFRTLERLVARENRKRLAQIVSHRFTETDINPPQTTTHPTLETSHGR